MRYFASASAHAGMFAQQLVTVEMEVADERHVHAQLREPVADRRTAAAASASLTVMRTSSEPARASALICCAVPSMSAVSVLVIDCTTIGAAPPTVDAADLHGNGLAAGMAHLGYFSWIYFDGGSRACARNARPSSASAGLSTPRCRCSRCRGRWDWPLWPPSPWPMPRITATSPKMRTVWMSTVIET